MFKDDLFAIYTDSFDSIWASFFAPKKTGFFVNLLKISKKDCENALSNLGVEFEEILPNFFVSPPEFKGILSRCELFNSGQIYLQNPSSYLSALNLGASGDMSVLDMCASPGGKSVAIAARLGSAANLACVEASKERFFTLKANLKKFGCEMARTFNKDAKSVAFTCKDHFDRILLDAPCSGYAKFGPEFKEKSAKEIKRLANLQKRLLNSALIALKPGGEMIYSTCTFYEQENEQVVQNALNSRFELALEPLEFCPPNSSNSALGVRIHPNDVYDGFFIAKIKKLR